tara:strand:- start:137 stop:1048 length:912 start_codon:yes stop_codon:yes gene_type:complete
MEIENMFYIHEKDWHELQAWASLAYEEDKNEISGLMTAVPDKEGRFKLSDVEILKQENGGTSTELDAEAVAEYKMKYAMKYKDKRLKFVWWHSHHTMAAFWSGTDLNEINAWKNSSFSLALVINLKEEYKFRVSIWNANGLPLEEHIDTSLEIIRGAKPKITNKMKTLYKELCEDSHPNYKGSSIKHYRHNKSWVGGYQANLLTKSNLDIESYKDVKNSIESLIDDFMSETLPWKQFKEGIKELRKECKTNKYDFTVKEVNVTKNQALLALQSIMPEEFFEFDNNGLKYRYESYNDNYYGGWG